MVKSKKYKLHKLFGGGYAYMKTADNSYRQDNYKTRYDDIDLKGRRNKTNHFGSIEELVTLEELVRDAITKEFDRWKSITPEEYDKNSFCYMTIRERLALDDSKFDRRSKSTYPRVPSLKRSNKEWEKFYRIFTYYACEVAIGKTRFIDGAKVKYIPLFKKILDEVWPDNFEQFN